MQVNICAICVTVCLWVSCRTYKVSIKLVLDAKWCNLNLKVIIGSECKIWTECRNWLSNGTPPSLCLNKMWFKRLSRVRLIKFTLPTQYYIVLVISQERFTSPESCFSFWESESFEWNYFIKSEFERKSFQIVRFLSLLQ